MTRVNFLENMQNIITMERGNEISTIKRQYLLNIKKTEI